MIHPALLNIAASGPLFPPLESAAFGVFWTLMGLFVGSFLNVCIHRFPLEGSSVFKPLRSHCPGCERQLTALENIPVLSWVVQRAKCKGCGTSIHWRYPLVEVLGAAAFFACWKVMPAGGSLPVLLIHTTVLSGLIVATFVDFDRYETPDQVSIGGMFAAPVASLAVPALHLTGPVALWMANGEPVGPVASLAECFAGMAAGGGFLWLVGWVGSKIYRMDAMGFGDVKLMAAGGGFIGVTGVAGALVIAVVVASVAGILNIGRFYCLVRGRQKRRGTTRRGVKEAVITARICGRYLPFGPYLALGIGIVLLDWKYVLTLLPFGG